MAKKSKPTHGGSRPGSGRKPVGKMRSIRMSDLEYDKVREMLKAWRLAAKQVE